jgi:hypothetical protein
MSEKDRQTGPLSRWVAASYILVLFFMALTGFGQMPIYNRYYMSDLPGLGWLADFYITREVHYVGAVALIVLSFYVAFDFILSKLPHVRLNPSGWARALLLTVTGISGVLVVIKNFPYVHFSDGFIIALDLFHLTAAAALLTTNLVCLIAKKKWASARAVSPVVCR